MLNTPASLLFIVFPADAVIVPPFTSKLARFVIEFELLEEISPHNY